jgi:hypothetical protein
VDAEIGVGEEPAGAVEAEALEVLHGADAALGGEKGAEMAGAGSDGFGQISEREILLEIGFEMGAGGTDGGMKPCQRSGGFIGVGDTTKKGREKSPTRFLGERRTSAAAIAKLFHPSESGIVRRKVHNAGALVEETCRQGKADIGGLGQAERLLVLSDLGRKDEERSTRSFQDLLPNADPAFAPGYGDEFRLGMAMGGDILRGREAIAPAEFKRGLGRNHNFVLQVRKCVHCGQALKSVFCTA